jgi:hypothetical protein
MRRAGGRRAGAGPRRGAAALLALGCCVLGALAAVATAAAASGAPPPATSGRPNHSPWGALALVTSTDSWPADAAVAVPTLAGDRVVFGYQLRNIGWSVLDNVSIDDPGVPAWLIDCDGGGDVVPRLLAGQSATCVARVSAGAGRHVDLVSAHGTVEGLGHVVRGFDVNGYLALPAGISTRVTLNGQPVSAEAPLTLPTRTPLRLVYQITNTGLLPLSTLGVTDTLSGTGAPICPSTVLAPGASLSCTATGTAATGSYSGQVAVSGVIARRTLWPDGRVLFGAPVGIASSDGYDGYGPAAPAAPPGLAPPAQRPAAPAQPLRPMPAATAIMGEPPRKPDTLSWLSLSYVVVMVPGALLLVRALKGDRRHRR